MLFIPMLQGQRLPREKDDIQFQLLDAALSILSQRPERQFLKTLARCYAILHSKAQMLTIAVVS